MFGIRLTLRPARRPPRDGAKPRPRSAVYADRLTRRMLRALIAVQLLGIGTVAALLLIAADGQDRVAAAASRRAVETSLTAMQRRIAGVASDYAMWDEAVDQLHFNRNKTWFDGYYNRDVLDSLQLEDAYILDGENRVTFAYSTLAEGGIQPAIAEQPGVRRLLAAGRTLAPDSVPLAIAGFVLIEGVVHIAGASRIRYIDDARSPPAAAASMLLFARRVDGPGLAVMATEHSLEPLTIVPGAPPPRHRHEEQVVLREFGTDRPIATILWHPEHPGKALLRQTALPTALALAVMLALLWTIARGARRAGRALDCAHAELAAARATLETKVVERTQALRQAEARLRSIFENSAEGIFQLAENGRYLGANPAMAAIFGYPSVEDFLAQAPDHTRQDAERRSEFVRLIETFGKVSDFVSRARRLDASPIWIAQNARLVREADGTAFYEGMLTDITHRKRIEERLVYDALHDPLTGLPNRKLFEQRLTQALAAAGGAAGGGAALRPTVLLLDCDRFKLINDSLGHAAGDELLIVLAQRLSLCLRHTDTLARLGGDEFAVLTGIGDGGSVHLAERLQAACRRPFLVRGREVFVTLSIGIAEAGPDLVEPSEVVRNADIAMYQAKSRGRGLTVAFTPDMHAAVLNRLRIESELRQALANDELRVVYQPIVALGGCTLAGFEALVRWQHPERGLIPPSEFIAIAEESRLIKPLGEIVLRRAAADMARWLAESGVTEPLFVSVNLSPLQLEDARLVDRIAGILAETGLPPARLKLEITETAMMANPIEVRAILAALDDLGIRLCIDDFGTGYSSLSQLYSYPFDTLKIDRSFISKLNCGDDGMALVRSILNLAGNLRLAVVAEGVEEPAQHAWLKQEGCTFGQGYLFARPLPAAEAGRMLRRLLPPARAVA